MKGAMATQGFRLEELSAHTAWLRRLANALSSDGSADDLVQETMMMAWRHAPERRDSLRPWLRRVMTNLIRMRHRSEQQRIERQRSWAQAVSSRAETEEELLDRHEGARRLAAAVSALDEPYRSTVLLRYAEQRTTGDIARLQGIPAGTVRWRLTEALNRLRLDLGALDDGRRSRAVALLPTPRSAHPLRARRLAQVGTALVGLTGLAVVLIWSARSHRPAPGGRPVNSAAVSSTSNQLPDERVVAKGRPRAPRPALLPPARIPAVENDPFSPGYDPLKLLPFAEPKRIFEAEPRVCSWAAAMEVRLERNVLAELRVRVPEATIETVTCRQSSCLLALVFPRGTPSDRLGAAMIALQRPMLASMVAFPAPDRSRPWRLPVYLLFAPAERDPAAYDRWYSDTRNEMARVLSGPNTPPANRPANPPAPVPAADATPRERTCRLERADTLAPPVDVPDQPSPLQALLVDRDLGAHAVKQAFQTVVNARVQICRRERSRSGWRDYSRARIRGWGDAGASSLAISRVSVEVAEGAPLEPALGACLERELAGTLTARPGRIPFAEVSDWLQTSVVFNSVESRD